MVRVAYGNKKLILYAPRTKAWNSVHDAIRISILLIDVGNKKRAEQLQIALIYFLPIHITQLLFRFCYLRQWLRYAMLGVMQTVERTPLRFAHIKKVTELARTDTAGLLHVRCLSFCNPCKT